MKKEWTEQDLRAFAENAQTAFEDVTLTEADEEAADTWQDDGLQVDYVLRNGQVDCVLRRLIEADGKLWQLQMTAPLAGSDLPEDRMTARERELCRDDMNHDFLTGIDFVRIADSIFIILINLFPVHSGSIKFLRNFPQRITGLNRIIHVQRCGTCCCRLCSLRSIPCSLV